MTAIYPETIGLSIRLPDFGAVFRALLPIRQRTAAYEVTTRLHKGCWIYEPVGVKPAFDLVYPHGLGGIQPDQKVTLHQYASGAKGPPIRIIAGLAAELLPESKRVHSLMQSSKILDFMFSKPRDIRSQTIKAIVGSGKLDLQELWSGLKKRPSWYDLSFKKIREKGKRTVMVPDYDAILESIVTNGEIVAPKIKEVLDDLGAEPGKVCVLTFSQGAGPGLVFADRMPPGYVKGIVMVSGSYVETPTSALRPGYFIRNHDIRAETIFPIGDIVPEIIGLTRSRVAEDLKKAFGDNSRVWTQMVKGKHALEGAVADFALKRVIGIMKEPARQNRPLPRTLRAAKAA